MFNIAAHSLVPDLGGAVVSGLQSGQNLRKGALQMQEAQALQQRQAALGQLAPQIAQGNQGALNQALSLDPTGQGFKGALDVQAAQAQAVKDKQEAETQFFAKAAVTLESAPADKRPLLYDAFQKMAVQSGFITPDEIEPYSPKVMEELAPFKMQARKLEDMTTTAQQDRTFGLDKERLNIARGQLQVSRENAASARDEKKIKSIPVDFAQKFEERLAMDMGGTTEELPQEDIKLLRERAAEKARSGLDFEAAYSQTISEMGLQENPEMFAPDYKINPGSILLFDAQGNQIQ